MQIAALYSHLNGEEYLIVHRPDLWKEVKSVIAKVDAEACRTKVSGEKSREGLRIANCARSATRTILSSLQCVPLPSATKPSVPGPDRPRARRRWRCCGRSPLARRSPWRRRGYERRGGLRSDSGGSLRRRVRNRGDSGRRAHVVEALGVAGAIDCDDDRVFALALIARNQPGLGDRWGAAQTIGSALEVAGRMADGRARASALCWIAEAQARNGDRDAALRSIAGASEAVNGAERGSDPDGIGHRIAMAQATAGDNRRAHTTARRIAETSGIDGLLAEISEMQCWENEVVEAVATARTIACADARRSAALANIARIRVRDGDPDGAAQPIALALEPWRARKQSRTVQDAHPRLLKSLR